MAQLLCTILAIWIFKKTVSVIAMAATAIVTAAHVTATAIVILMIVIVIHFATTAIKLQQKNPF